MLSIPTAHSRKSKFWGNDVLAPVITSSTTAVGTVEESFIYLITATGDPSQFEATGLPSGLFVNEDSGLISGNPRQAEVFVVALTARARAPWPITPGGACQPNDASLGLRIRNSIIANNGPVGVYYLKGTGVNIGISCDIDGATRPSAGTRNVSYTHAMSKLEPVRKGILGQNHRFRSLSSPYSYTYSYTPISLPLFLSRIWEIRVYE